MIDKQEVLLRLACSALQGGMDADEVIEGVDIEGDLWYIAQTIYPQSFHVDDDDSDYDVSTTKTY